MSEKEQFFDVVIIGAGPAGLSAGINAARAGLRTLILEAEDFSGKTTGASTYENYPGFPEGIMAAELLKRMQKQASQFGAVIRYHEKATRIDLKHKLKKVTTSKTMYQSSALVIATGTQRRKLNVPGEIELVGKGVSYCRACDGPFFKGLKVAIVGFAKDAVRDALLLSEMAKDVLLITQGGEINVQDVLRKELLKKKNVKVIRGQVVAILGEHVVKSIRIKLASKQELLEQVDGVFVSLGKTPATGIFEGAGVEVDERGCIKIDRWQRTNIEGAFAAGDCTCGGMQVATAAGEGAMASLRALAYIRQVKT